MADRLNGHISRIVTERGFGFLKSGDTDYFFHHSALENCTVQQLKPGDAVTFLPSNGPKGPRAEEIILRANGGPA